MLKELALLMPERAYGWSIARIFQVVPIPLPPPLPHFSSPQTSPRRSLHIQFRQDAKIQLPRAFYGFRGKGQNGCTRWQDGLQANGACLASLCCCHLPCLGDCAGLWEAGSRQSPAWPPRVRQSPSKLNVACQLAWLLPEHLGTTALVERWPSSAGDQHDKST